MDLRPIFSQAGNKLSMLFPYTSFPAGTELILKLTKNTASGDVELLENLIVKSLMLITKYM